MVMLNLLTTGHGTLSPVDVCRMFGISRTTLFRWEAADLLPSPERSATGQRGYRRHHVRIVGALVRKSVAEEISTALRSNATNARLRDLWERIYLAELFAEDDPLHGLEQLEGLALRQDLTSHAVRLLVDTALLLAPGNPARIAIWRLLYTLEMRRAEKEHPTC